MDSATDDVDDAALSRSVVLMARIVDREGRCIGRSDAAAIRYSVYEMNPLSAEEPTVVPGRVVVPLTVNDVLFDELQRGGGWSVDGDGHNFRHVFELPAPQRGTRRSRRRFEVRYDLVSGSGEATTICFEIRA
jgi:hypothetical protein